jgi:hypothetical protein
MRKRLEIALAAASLLALLVISSGCQSPPADQSPAGGQAPSVECGSPKTASDAVPVQPPTGAPLFADDFSAAKLDPAKWERTKANDFETETVDLVKGRLHMGAATVGTDDRTVKFHGVRSVAQVVDLARGATVSFDVDWSNQANGCYMTVDAYLCPTVAENPGAEKSWLSLSYIGVPPGRNGRCQIATSTNGSLTMVYTENWPKERTGRHIGLQHVDIKVSRDSVELVENGKRLLETKGLKLDFGKAYLYLQHSSHSNYPLREVCWDNVAIR